MKQPIETIVFVFLLIFFSFSHKVYAGHVFATELTYQCLGNNQYLVTATLYKECSSAPSPANVTITISSYSCNQILSDVDLPLIPALSGMMVTPVCPNFAANTACNGGAIPAEDLAVYQDTITLPTACPDWVIGLSHAVRSSYYTNLINPGNDNIYIEALLDNTFGSCYSSPILKNYPMLYACAGQAFEYDLSAFYHDADQLTYTFITPRINSTQNANFQPGLSLSNPLALQAGTFSIDNQKGILSFTPQAGINQIACISLLIEKWIEGRLVASTITELDINVSISCNNQPVLETNTTAITPGWLYNDVLDAFINCGGTMDSIEFETIFYDADGNTLLLDIDSANWNNTLGTNNWNVALTTTAPFSVDSSSTASTISNPSYNSMIALAMNDNSCPYTSSHAAHYNFLPAFINASTNKPIVCRNSNTSVNLSIQGSHFIQSVIWAQIPNGAPYTGMSDPLVVNPSVTVNLDTAVTLLYEVTANLGSCIAVDTVAIQVVDNPSIAFNTTDASTSSTADGSITTTVSGNLAQFNYAWQNGMTTNNLQNLSANDYVVTVTDFYGCSTIDTATVSVNSNITTLTNHKALKVYPNPADGQIQIELDYSASISILLYNNLGQIVLEKPLITIQQNNPYTLLLPAMYSGIYWLKILENDKSYGQKIIID